MKTSIPLRPFYFIRHGESEWNALNKFAGGQTDTPLTEMGRNQAEATRIIFKKISSEISHIIHSPLSRAVETASILNQNKEIPMVQHNDLREIDAGNWAGMMNEDVKKKWKSGEAPLDGENLDDFAHRIQKVFTQILNNLNYLMPFISAHGRIINAIDTIYGIEMRPLQVSNCQILKYVPSEDTTRKYPWDVYIIKENKNVLAEWSQI